MNSLFIDLVVGTRPNVVKLAPVMRAAREEGRLAVRVVHTGQHRDAEMSRLLFDDLGVAGPDIQLEPADSVGRPPVFALEASYARLLRDPPATPPGLGLDTPRPDGVVVFGDVDSTAAAALAASKQGIPVAHVEAGLRSFDLSMPEERNRILTDSLADLLLVSEESGLVNLRREGLERRVTRFVGNVMIDTLVHELDAARTLFGPRARGLGLGKHSYAYVTLHRPSNVDSAERLSAVISRLLDVASTLPVVFPIHPRTRRRLEAFGLLEKLESHPHIHALAPLSYRHNLSLLDGARFVITDSGGVQEETTALGISCLTLRGNTERPATLTLGTNAIVSSIADVPREVTRLLGGPLRRATRVPGWDGSAATRVVAAIVERWGHSETRTRPVTSKASAAVARTCVPRTRHSARMADSSK